MVGFLRQKIRSKNVLLLIFEIKRHWGYQKSAVPKSCDELKLRFKKFTNKNFWGLMHGNCQKIKIVFWKPIETNKLHRELPEMLFH